MWGSKVHIIQTPDIRKPGGIDLDLECLVQSVGSKFHINTCTFEPLISEASHKGGIDLDLECLVQLHFATDTTHYPVQSALNLLVQ